MKDYDYIVYIPSGNPTALVMGLEKDPLERKKINDEIMGLYDDFVEQVGFVNTDINNPELMMAGGEFCGNATRSAVKYYLNDKKGNLKMKVSGVPEKLNAGMDEDGNAWVDMPIIKGPYEESVKKINEISAIVKMYGITHVVIESGDINKEYTKEELKKYAYSILERQNLLCEDAAGVMFVNRIDDENIEISPVVFVRSINTLFYETACGSGTTAVAIYESAKKRENIDLNILQPSGNTINVKTDVDDKNIYNVRISGKVLEYEKKKMKR